MTIRIKIALAVMVLLMMFSIIGGVSWQRTRGIQSEFEFIVSKAGSKDSAAYEMEINLLGIGLAVIGYTRHPDQAHLARIEEDVAKFLASCEIFRVHAATEHEIQLIDETKEQFNSFMEIGRQMIATKDQLTADTLTYALNSIAIGPLLDGKIDAFLRFAPTESPFGSAQSIVKIKNYSRTIDTLVANYVTSPQAKYRVAIAEEISSFEAALKFIFGTSLDVIVTDSRGEMWRLLDEKASLITQLLDLSDELMRLHLQLFVLRAELDDLLDDKIQAITRDQIEVSRATVLDLTDRTMLLLAAMSIAGLSIGSIIWWLLTVMVIRPADHLAKGLDDIISGDYSVELPVVSRDELGRLTTHFNSMIGMVRRAHREEAVIREELETLVAERTAELRKANAGLLTEIAQRQQAEKDRELSEARIQQAQRMETLGQLAGGVAHDFNNMLQAILGFTELAKAGLEPDDDRFRDLEGVSKAATNASALTRQLLTFGRRQPLTMRPLSLNDIIAHSLSMLRRLVGTHIEFRVFPGKEIGTVLVDPDQINQVLLNLSINAGDAMPGGGILTIETEDTEVAARSVDSHPWMKEGRYVRLSVTDNGSGMDEATLAQIFDPFFTTKEVGKGTGMGLSTVYGIVKSHSGFIYAYSELGKGTIFKVYFPVSEKSAMALGKDTLPQDPPTGSETILVAEDEESVRLLVLRILEEAGYKVLVAEDGEKAVEMFHEHIDKIDLVMLDVVMPKLGGKQAFIQIREARPDLPVLFCSGYSANSIQTLDLLSTRSALIQKPYLPHDLLRKIRQVLESDARCGDRSDAQESGEAESHTD